LVSRKPSSEEKRGAIEHGKVNLRFPFLTRALERGEGSTLQKLLGKRVAGRGGKVESPKKGLRTGEKERESADARLRGAASGRRALKKERKGKLAGDEGGRRRKPSSSKRTSTGLRNLGERKARARSSLEVPPRHTESTLGKRAAASPLYRNGRARRMADVFTKNKQITGGREKRERRVKGEEKRTCRMKDVVGCCSANRGKGSRAMTAFAEKSQDDKIRKNAVKGPQRGEGRKPAETNLRHGKRDKLAKPKKNKKRREVARRKNKKKASRPTWADEDGEEQKKKEKERKSEDQSYH